MKYFKNLFVFDIETVPDIEAGRRLLGLENADNGEVRKALSNYHLQITDGKNDFLRQPFHKVVAISFLEAELAIDENGQEKYNFKQLRSGGDLASSEAELIKGFFHHLKKNPSRLVSFNGKNFDLPVLKYGAMKHKIEASWLHKMGDKWNNYQQKYSLDWHCDLADAFSDFGSSARVKMNELCAVFKLAGKIDTDGSKVEEMYDDGKLQEIRDYCETDVLNSYLLYLIFQHHTGSISDDVFEKSKNQIYDFLNNNLNKLHFKKFLDKLEI